MTAVSDTVNALEGSLGRDAYARAPVLLLTTLRIDILRKDTKVDRTLLLGKETSAYAHLHLRGYQDRRSTAQARQRSAGINRA